MYIHGILGANSCNVMNVDCMHIHTLYKNRLFDVQKIRSDAKLSEISAALSAHLQQQCSCSLSVQQSLFSCLGTTDSQTVVFLADLSYTALTGVDIPSLTSWVISIPHIAVASTQLQMDTLCPVVIMIDSLQPESCTSCCHHSPTY